MLPASDRRDCRPLSNAGAALLKPFRCRNNRTPAGSYRLGRTSSEGDQRMMRKTAMALVALAAIGLAGSTAAFAHGPGGHMGGGHFGGGHFGGFHGGFHRHGFVGFGFG